MNARISLNSKLLFSLLFFVFMAGFILGKTDKNAVVKQIKSNEINKKYISSTNTVQNTQTKKDIKQASEKIINKKEYYYTGKLKQETETKVVYDYSESNNQGILLTNKSDINSSTFTKNTLETDYQKNWMGGLFISPLDYKDFTQYTIQGSYRIYGPLWVSAQTNITFTRPMLGIQITF